MTILSAPPVITLAVLSDPRPGDPCGYCGLALRAERMVTVARVGYCDAVCADLGIHACSDCGDDIRTPAARGMGCPHTAGWVS